MKTITIVIPAYNEEENIVPLTKAIHEHFPRDRYAYRLLFVDDGSSDGTLNVLETLSQEDSHVFYLSLSRNFGHQNALKAGIDYAEGDAVITMDCDLQHPPRLLEAMIAKWEEGFDIVYTRRAENQNASFVKRKSGKAFYNLFNWLAEVNIEQGAADFRLMDRRVADIFSQFGERDLFIRGLVRWMGFRQFGIDYEPDKRLKGKTKYSFRKMTVFAVSGITSMSIRPLYAAIYLGLGLSLLAVLSIPFVIYSFQPRHHIVFIWASLLVTIVFFGGLQLTILGMIGLYIGKTYTQVKHRPLYIIQKSNLSIEVPFF
ncbi:MAG: glycosyltransferase family 2 protein [Microbacter sp.]